MAALIADDRPRSPGSSTSPIVLVHHRSTKKGAATLRGSSSIEDQADLVFTLERVGEDRDRERRRLKAIKYRIDAEPPPLWLRMGMARRRFTFAPPSPTRAAMVPTMSRVPTSSSPSAWTRSPIRCAATAAGPRPGSPLLSAPTSRTGRSSARVKLLLDRGTWKAQGSTRDRRLRPADDSGHSGQSLGDGLIGPNPEASEEDQGEPEKEDR